MKLDISVLHDEAVKTDLHMLGNRAANPLPAFSRVGLLLEAGIRRQFASRGAEFGKQWPALAAETAARKGSSTPLVDTGAMLGSLYSKPLKASVKAGLKDYKARFAQGGTSRGEPARPVVGASRGTEGAAINMVRDYLLGDLT